MGGRDTSVHELTRDGACGEVAGSPSSAAVGLRSH